MNTRTQSVFLGILSFTIILFVWGAVTYSGVVKPFFLPTPPSVFKAMFNLFIKYDFAKDVLVSVARILTGFLIATMVAIPLGMVLGMSKKVEVAVEPVIDFIRYTPIPAFIPLLILWFGIGELEKIVVIVLSVFVQLVLMVANSVSQVPQSIKEFAITLGANKRELITRVIYPHSKPRIFNDLRVSMGWAWSGLMMAEIVGATSGIGFVIVQSQRLLKTPNVISAIIVVGILGVLTDIILKRVYKRMYPWAERESE